MMDNNEVEVLLENYTNLQEQKGRVQQTIEAQRAAILAPVQGQLDELEAETQPKLAEVDKKIKAVDADLRITGIRSGVSVKGRGHHLVFIPGGEYVDMVEFAKYVARHPEASYLLKTSDPSVQIRKVKA